MRQQQLRGFLPSSLDKLGLGVRGSRAKNKSTLSRACPHHLLLCTLHTNPSKLSEEQQQQQCPACRMLSQTSSGTTLPSPHCCIAMYLIRKEVTPIFGTIFFRGRGGRGGRVGLHPCHFRLSLNLFIPTVLLVAGDERNDVMQQTLAFTPKTRRCSGKSNVLRLVSE